MYSVDGAKRECSRSCGFAETLERVSDFSYSMKHEKKKKKEKNKTKKNGTKQVGECRREKVREERRVGYREGCT
jgi:hypothetical protein